MKRSFRRSLRVEALEDRIAPSAVPTLVKDINPGAFNSDPRFMAGLSTARAFRFPPLGAGLGVRMFGRWRFRRVAGVLADLPFEFGNTGRQTLDRAACQ